MPEWSRAVDRDQATRLGLSRISESCRTAVALQADPRLANARRDFFLPYINAFNEWHEGDEFEPVKDRADLTADERAVGSHHPDPEATGSLC